MKRLLVVPVVLLLLCACNTTPPKPDKELFLAFYKEIVIRGGDIDSEYALFNKAVARGDAYGALEQAINIKDTVEQLWSKFYNIEVPELKNHEQQKQLAKAKEILASAYLNKNEALSAFIEYSKNPSAYSKVTMKSKTDKWQVGFYLGMGTLITAGKNLGLTEEEIKKGGL